MNENNIDKASARRAFSRAADSYDEAAVMQHEIGQRMVARLDYIKLEPKRILDVGCGSGRTTELLLKRYPKAQIIAMDFALPMLQHTRKRGTWLRKPRCVGGDLDKLPFADQSFDLVFSNVAVQWSVNPPQAMAELHRVVKPDGLLMFSSFGPDTLKELNAAWRECDQYPHVHQFVDMHDYGDMLLHAGTLDPVMDAENIKLTYSDVVGLLRDLKAIGAVNVASDRNKGMMTTKTLKQLAKAYQVYKDDDGRLPATYEVIYGHAWGATQRQQSNEVHIAAGDIPVLNR